MASTAPAAATAAPQSSPFASPREQLRALEQTLTQAIKEDEHGKAYLDGEKVHEAVMRWLQGIDAVEYALEQPEELVFTSKIPLVSQSAFKIRFIIDGIKNWYDGVGESIENTAGIDALTIAALGQKVDPSQTVRGNKVS
jgi:hypothetical protein